MTIKRNGCQPGGAFEVRPDLLGLRYSLTDYAVTDNGQWIDNGPPRVLIPHAGFTMVTKRKTYSIQDCICYIHGYID